MVYFLVVCLVGAFDFGATTILLEMGTAPLQAKLSACAMGLLFNFLGRRYFVFPEASPWSWWSQLPDSDIPLNQHKSKYRHYVLYYREIFLCSS
jgi:hypothetical protein